MATCKKGVEEFDLLYLECAECEMQDECSKASSNNGKVVLTEEKVDDIKKTVAESFTCIPGTITNMQGCMNVVNDVMSKYKESGAKKSPGHKERRDEVKTMIRPMAGMIETESKLNFLVDCAEYVFFA